MRLLVSPKNVAEAKECVKSNAVDIIDIKNPNEGSLGANFPWVIRQIRKIATNHEMSAAIGDIQVFQPGTVSLAARAVCELGVDYVKVGLMLQDPEESLELLKMVVKAVKEVNQTINVVAAGYADHALVNSLDVFELPGIGSSAGCDIVMIDTARKNGVSLLDLMSESELSRWCGKAIDCDLQTALAGSVHLEDIKI
ncbi:MAG: (5-formylfuran-3-yl)methyl phosphate synthase, partial [Candidatus Hodarchaeales archaeon]